MDLRRKTFQSSAKFFAAFCQNAIFASKGSWLKFAKHAIYVTGKIFSWNAFSRKLVVCIIFLRVGAGYSWFFVRFFGRFAFSGRIGLFRGKTFFPRNSNFVFGFWATKNGFREAMRHVCENCLLGIQRNNWSNFFWLCT